MKRKALLTVLVITALTGCKVQQSCDAYSLQCDELYSDYNCGLQPRTLTTPRYSTTYAPVPWYYSNNAYYYPNTQSVYYVPIYIEPDCGESASPSINRPRPSIYHNGPSETSGTAVENNSNGVHRKPQNNAPPSRKKRD